MFQRQKWLTLPLVGGIALIAAGTASAAVDKVICVPWQGDVNKQHTAISGQAAQLKCVVKTTDTTAVYVKWVFGDGAESAVTTLSGSTKHNVATTHVYTAATDTPFTAKLQVSNTTPFALVKEDPYLLKIQSDEINARINIGIDKGLWWLYTTGSSGLAGTYDGSPDLAWSESTYVSTLVSPTASAVHAFGINNHKVKGNPDEDPYVEAVQQGMNYLVKGYTGSSASCPALQAVAISTVSHGADGSHNPDVNVNGYGTQAYGCSGDPPYQTGQVMDAIVASGYLPSDSTGRDFASSSGHIWTYQELLQDLADMHSWGQWDGAGCTTAVLGNSGICGSWWYGWNYAFPGDNSASQWAAIGMLPAQEAPWNVVVPSWVKTYNANWLQYSNFAYGANRAFGYNGPNSCAGDLCLSTTTSGMVQMIFDGQTTGDVKWAPAQKHLADNWYHLLHNASSWGGNITYGWYSFAKAMRLAIPDPVTQITKAGDTPFDWYYGDSSAPTCTNQSNCRKGLATRILETQAAAGSWTNGQMTSPPLTTAWMIITLRPTVFAAAPIACFGATPNPSFANLDVAFNPSCSGHSESGKTIANLTKFEWDWNNDGVYDEFSTSPDTALHQFACASLPCHYPVKLKVTDDNNPALTATTVVTIDITEPPHPPVANSGGPYMASMCINDSLTLDGSASFDQDEGQHQAGCTTCQGDTITAWDWDLEAPTTFDAIDAVGSKPSVNIGSFFPVGSHTIGLRVTDNTLNAYQSSGSPNLTNAAFDTVDVKGACMCNLAARAKSGKIQLTWAAVAGATYDIYRSTLGPNNGFAKIASNVVTSYATYLDSTVVNGTKYYYRVVASTGCGSQAAAATASAR
jgi:hypothetical protein